MSGVTDCYQPLERKMQLTAALSRGAGGIRNPVCIITKNFLVTRDADLLAELAKYNAVGRSTFRSLRWTQLLRQSWNRVRRCQKLAWKLYAFCMKPAFLPGFWPRP
jgi:hypothetical protein